MLEGNGGAPRPAVGFPKLPPRAVHAQTSHGRPAPFLRKAKRYVVAPSVAVFANAMGGRVAVLSQGLSGNRTSSIYSSRKQELFVRLFDWLSQGRLDVCAPETPCTWVLACVSERGDEMLVMVNNLAGEFDILAF